MLTTIFLLVVLGEAVLVLSLFHDRKVNAEQWGTLVSSLRKDKETLRSRLDSALSEEKDALRAQGLAELELSNVKAELEALQRRKIIWTRNLDGSKTEVEMPAPQRQQVEFQQWLDQMRGTLQVSVPVKSNTKLRPYLMGVYLLCVQEVERSTFRTTATDQNARPGVWPKTFILPDLPERNTPAAAQQDLDDFAEVNGLKTPLEDPNIVPKDFARKIAEASLLAELENQETLNDVDAPFNHGPFIPGQQPSIPES
jgi:hypothetical protein